MIKYIIPDNEMIRPANLFLLDLMKIKPEWFYEGIEIEGVFGCIVNCAWEGGRLLSTSLRTKDDIEEVLRDYKNRNVKYNFTFSNLLLQKKHLEDVGGNMQMEVGSKYFSRVIVSSEMLKTHIHERYPIIKFTSSITKGVLSQEELLKLLEDKSYDIVVPNTDYNDMLQDFIPEKYRSKCEILINDCCPPKCPWHQTDYEMSSKEILGLYNSEKIKRNGSICLNKGREKYSSPWWYENYLLEREFSEVKDFAYVRKMESLGFKHFKIDGRGYSFFKTILNYAEYLIKDEYKMHFLTEILIKNEEEWKNDLL